MTEENIVVRANFEVGNTVRSLVEHGPHEEK
jgi:hypothetical protein